MPLGNSAPHSRAYVLQQIREFGAELADLINNLTGTDLRLMAVWKEEDNDGRLGFKLDPLGIPSRIPLPGPDGGSSCYLYILFRLTLNDAGHLVTTKSALRLFLDEEEDATPLFRYEYSRDYPIRYPNPHLHVEGQNNDAWRELNERTNQKKGLGQLHFPLGGKRYRPSVEDFLEFLIMEGYVKGREGWEDAIEIVRSTYHQKQLGAAVKDDQEFAASVLRDNGYKVKRLRR